jgi:hypothetical protein
MRRNRPNDLTRHHRRPRSIGGTNTPSNISMVPRHQHEAWHELFQNWDVHRIAKFINDRYLDSEYELVPVVRRHHA